ncbi:MAG: HupE/UreJ family protein [Methyloligellaceae bacterium]
MFLGVAAASAHFKANVGNQLIHIEHLETGLRLFIRTQLPDNKVVDEPSEEDLDRMNIPREPGGTDRPGAGRPGESHNNRHTPELFYSLEEAEEAAPVFAAIFADGIQLRVNDAVPDFEIENSRIYARHREPPFGTLAAAKESFQSPTASADLTNSYRGALVFDLILFYPMSDSNDRFEYYSSFQGEKSGQTIINDHGPSGMTVYAYTDRLTQPILINPSLTRTAITFVTAGWSHILSGIDHILYLLMLVVGAAALGRLAIWVTGFTIGHTITLIIGTFGFVPGFAWFFPSVEILIALSIIYTGLAAIYGNRESITFLLTVVVGLVHGLGFSTALSDLLETSGPDLMSRLLFFNLGIELGQLVIVGLSFPLLQILRRQSEFIEHYGNRIIVYPVVAIAVFWTVNRFLDLLNFYS